MDLSTLVCYPFKPSSPRIGSDTDIYYTGTDLATGEQIAVKLNESQKPYQSMGCLRTEGERYALLQSGTGFPRFHFFSTQDDFHALGIELIGPSLVDLMEYCGGRFSLKTVLLLADQAISRLQFMHKRGVLHRDVKPDNLAMGIGNKGHILHVVDFGCSRMHDRAEQFRNTPNRTVIGTYLYGSTNNFFLRGMYTGLLVPLHLPCSSLPSRSLPLCI
jgi:serine/threonine protein kinase